MFVRKLRVLLSFAILLCLVAPAVAECCVSVGDAMPCCAKKHAEVRLVPKCCMSSPQTQQPQTPASIVKPVRAAVPDAVMVSAAPALSVEPSSSLAAIDRSADPPAPSRLFLRLSVIRR
jgi:hypothetical protein